MSAVTAPSDLEQQWLAAGYRRIAGIDEVGRGCWAGPVVAAAVVLPAAVLMAPTRLLGVTDSKALTAAQRERRAAEIASVALGIGVGSVEAWLIDQIGIVAATRLAMEQAVLSLPALPDALLIDALRLPGLALPQAALVRGDARSLSIAAASIIAKTARDRRMRALDRAWPHGFGQHKGYGTALHQARISEHGVTPLHRRSFRPLWGAD